MNVKVTVNGEEKKVGENTAKLLAAIATVKDPGSDTIQGQLRTDKARIYAGKTFLTLGSPEDVFVVTQIGTQAGKPRISEGTATREVLARKMAVALDFEQWATSIVNTVEGKEVAAKKEADEDYDAV